MYFFSFLSLRQQSMEYSMGRYLSEIAEILKTVNSYWLLPGVACVIIFIWESQLLYFI